MKFPGRLTLLIPILVVLENSNAQMILWTQPLSGGIDRFVPTEIRGDLSKLSDGDRKALRKLVEAARLIDSMYLRQVWSGNIGLLNRLKGYQSLGGQGKLHEFTINMGPWSKLDHDKPFVD